MFRNLRDFLFIGCFAVASASHSLFAQSSAVVDGELIRRFELEVTQATGHFGAYIGGKCVVTIWRQHGNSIYVRFEGQLPLEFFENLPHLLDLRGEKSSELDDYLAQQGFDRFSRGVSLPANQYPLDPGLHIKKDEVEGLSTDITYLNDVFKVLDIEDRGDRTGVSTHRFVTDSDITQLRLIQIRDEVALLKKP